MQHNDHDRVYATDEDVRVQERGMLARASDAERKRYAEWARELRERRTLPPGPRKVAPSGLTRYAGPLNEYDSGGHRCGASLHSQCTLPVAAPLTGAAALFWSEALSNSNYTRLRCLAPRVAAAAFSIGLAVLMLGCSVLGMATRLPWNTAEALTGGFPVGRWACFKHGIDYEALKDANEYPLFNPWCTGGWVDDSTIGATGTVAFHADATGWLITRDDSTDRTAGWFMLAGSTAFYKRTKELRWAVAASTLTVTTTRIETYTIESIRDDWFIMLLDDSYIGPFMLVRIGSPLYREILTFSACVRANGGRALFDVEECTPPSFG